MAEESAKREGRLGGKESAGQGVAERVVSAECQYGWKREDVASCVFALKLVKCWRLIFWLRRLVE